MAAGDLCTVSDVKAHAGSSGTASDLEIGRLVTAASGLVRSFTSWPFGMGSQSYSEIRDGSGGTELYLRNPVASVASLAVCAVPISAQVADGQPGYFLAGQSLCLSGYRFTRGRKNVRVAYSGDAGAPVDVAQACVEIVVAMAKRGPRGGEMTGQSMPESGANITYSLKDIPAAAKAMLMPYRHLVPA